jgi:hypothetical protein
VLCMKIKLFSFLLGALFLSESFGSTYSKDVAARRFNKLFRFIAKNSLTREVALYSLLAKRCARYADTWFDAGCQMAVAEQINILDYDIHFPAPAAGQDTWSMDSFVFVAFRSTLIELLYKEETTQYLTELSQGLSAFLTGEDPEFNIWEMSVRFYRSELKAARALAVLFQDTSLVKLHLAYLYEKNIVGDDTYLLNIERLSAAIDSINMILDYSEDNFRYLFYPKNLVSKLRRNLYHFYVPMYLSMELQNRGYSQEDALAAPLMLTLSYEFITSASDYRYLFKDPESFNPQTQMSTLFDIYAGYSGTLYGIDKKTNPSVLQNIIQKFSESTKSGVTYLLQWAN